MGGFSFFEAAAKKEEGKRARAGSDCNKVRLFMAGILAEDYPLEMTGVHPTEMSRLQNVVRGAQFDCGRGAILVYVHSTGGRSRFGRGGASH